MIAVVVVIVSAAGVQRVVDAREDDDMDMDMDGGGGGGFFDGTSSMSDCCIMSRLRQLSAMLSRFFQMVATVLLARPSSRATSLLLLPRSISWMIFIFCLIVNASRFRPCVGGGFRDAQYIIDRVNRKEDDRLTITCDRPVRGRSGEMGT